MAKLVKRFNIMLAMMVPFWLGGCGLGSLTKPVAQTQIDHTLLPSSVQCRYLKLAPVDADLFIPTIVAVAPYNSDNMWYSTIDGTLQSYSYHEWAAAPTSLLQPLIAKAIRQAHFFHSVWASSTSTAIGMQMLSLQLVSFYQSLGKQVFNISIVAQLTNAEHQVIASRPFMISVPSAPNYQGMVEAANRASGKMACDVMQFAVTAQHMKVRL